MGTTNDPQPLPNDPTGNRRFVPIDIATREGGTPALRSYLDKHRTQLWSEAKWLWNHRQHHEQTPWLPDRLKTVQNAINAGRMN